MKTKLDESQNDNPLMNNQAFIDGQNLYFNTRAYGWAVDLARFRVYLREKFNVQTAYYFLGAVDESNQDIYENIQRAGFILTFREHSQSILSKKKGNVDTDIVFTIMKKIADKEDFNKIILVSGDGDYVKMVKYLIEKNKFAKLLAPNQKSMSSLYRQIDREFYMFLDEENLRRKIQYVKKGSPRNRGKIAKKSTPAKNLTKKKAGSS